MKSLKYNKAIFCIIALVLVIIQFIPITSTAPASSKNTETKLAPSIAVEQKVFFFAFVNINSGTIGSFDFSPPAIVNWRSNGEISITGVGDRRVPWIVKYESNGQLAEGSLTLFIGSMTDSQIRGSALVSVLFINT